MKKLFTAALSLLFLYAGAQTNQTKPNPSDYEKFVSREGALILTSSEEFYDVGSLDRSLQVSLVEAKDVTANGEVIKAINVSVNKSNAYLSKSEVSMLVGQMKKIQLLLVDGEISKKHTATFSIQNSLMFEVSYNESKKTWKYNVGVLTDGREKFKEITQTEFQDFKIKLEDQLEKL